MYIKKTWVAGKTIEVKKTYSSRYGRKIPRGGRIAATPEAMQKVNLDRAIGELRRILNANFAENDWHLTLTYPVQPPPTKEQAKRDRERLLRKLREVYRKQGLEMKFVAVTEYKRARIHHHIVMNQLPGGIRTVKRLWKEILAAAYYNADERANGEPCHVIVRCTLLDDSGQYGELASYLCKEFEKSRRDSDAVHKQRYSCSRNLIRPQPKVEIISAAKFKGEPPERKGYYIDKKASWSGYSPVSGLPAQETVYVQLTRAATKQRRRR